MKIAFFEMEKWEIKHMKKALKGHDLAFFEETTQNADLSKIKDFDVISVFIYSRVDKDVIKKLSKLKMVSTRSTGFDHIDLDTCKKENITVTNVPYYGENTVAEHTFGLILALSRNIHKAYVRTMQGDFSLKGLQGFDLKDKTIGVVGAGHIGLRVIKMAKGFGMHALAFDIHKEPFLAEVLRYAYTDMDTLLSTSDVISLHAPYNEHTHHLINMDNVKSIKKGALLINTSRGGLIDTDALIYALDKGILAGAGLDVLEKEDLLKKDRFLSKHTEEELNIMLKNENLMKRDNVVITPHLAFDSQEALQRILDTTIRNIKDFAEGTLEENIVK